MASNRKTTRSKRGIKIAKRLLGRSRRRRKNLDKLKKEGLIFQG